MLRRYFSTDIPDIREFFRAEPDKAIALNAGIQSIDRLHFDIWLSRDEAGQLAAVIFRNYSDFYLRTKPTADLGEVSSFIRFAPAVGSLCCHLETATLMMPLLPDVIAFEINEVAVQHLKPEPLAFALDYTRVQGMKHYRMVYELLRTAENMELTRFDDYYHVRRNTDKSWSGRTYCLIHDDVAYATASSMGEGDASALIVDVATHPDFRRKGLGKALLTVLCAELHNGGKTPYVMYRSPEAKAFYQVLGFTDLYRVIRMSFRASSSPLSDSC